MRVGRIVASCWSGGQSDEFKLFVPSRVIYVTRSTSRFSDVENLIEKGRVMQNRFTASAMNRLLVIEGVSASPSSDLYDTGLIMVIPPASVLIVTGVFMGPVVVGVEPLQNRPTEDDNSWEDVAEFTARRIHSVPMSVHGEMELPAEGVPDLSPGDAELVRIRVSAAGRDENYDLAVSEPSERYLVQVWPAEDEHEPVSWRSSSRTAASRRASKPLAGGAAGAVAG